MLVCEKSTTVDMGGGGIMHIDLKSSVTTWVRGGGMVKSSLDGKATLR